MTLFWQAKIWGLLHDPVLKALHCNTGRGSNSCWKELRVMEQWRQNNWNPEESQGTFFKHILLADYITSASDRSAIGSLSESINYAPKNQSDQGLEIRHLLSGKSQDWKLQNSDHEKLINASNRADHLNEIEKKLFDCQIIDPTDNQLKSIREIENPQKVFWWLWRCLPIEVCNSFSNDQSLFLMPAETRIPDGSIWSHTSLTAAVAGALTGTDLTDEVLKRWPSGQIPSRPYIGIFSFSPVQELIKASRKMRDFWAGSWILHYLSAKVCWELARIYGPDSLIYPCLFEQPLIDTWLLKQWPDFKQWIPKPRSRQVLTAGFPNVIVLILPQNAVKAAMQTAKQILLKEWKELSHLVFVELQGRRNPSWMPNLTENSSSWKLWLDAQWQTYWSAFPLGDLNQQLRSSEIYKENEEQIWRDAQNKLCNLSERESLFLEEETQFLQRAGELRKQKQHRYPSSVNVGSWWPHIFDQTRFALTSIKNARTWEIPTAFGPRSTISGLGPVVHPDQHIDKHDWLTEGDSRILWKQDAGLFDGIEELNATETVKRVLHKVLPELLNLNEHEIAGSYPDLTAGVAGYLKLNSEKLNSDHVDHFHNACQGILDDFDWANNVISQMQSKWGIPWVDGQNQFQSYHPRLLNAGWLVEDKKNLNLQERQELRTQVQTKIDSYYPQNNPASWYVIAAGDGDGMSEWLKGKHLNPYQDYVPNQLLNQMEKPPEEKSSLFELENSVRQSFQAFLKQKKRMGPSTHVALSRALLDFSNQLVPYITEQRYAGRLIYSGGDDVLASTNLWEWDSWLWDIRECFKGNPDPGNQFSDDGDYWQWKGETLPNNLAKRPLFTMGHKATISFGIVIAHHSVPMAIALDNLWEAEAQAKEHLSPDKQKKNAIQVRVIYGNGNVLKSTTKFETFNTWRKLIELPKLDSAIFEQAATIWNQHPAPVFEAIAPWTQSFCSRREQFESLEEQEDFKRNLTSFLENLWQTTTKKDYMLQVNNWLKLAAFILRNRQIKLGGKS
jgi:CRISPR-associated protein Cmr2